ncbi:hypothetical protein VPNG_02762 [Cytospora leucostoma]|uniref:Fasciclin domain family protein n=1 Tax=Cytospora leucostoma TaxID=1230097 RepID=A0A423XIW4_9PEZI|nr:hypothetical protein VPNG_02762 [Cytospora leucostoma]
MDEVAAPLPSQASSHFPLEPVSGATLFDQEKRRKDGLKKRGNCLTGCRELDHEVLLGGFERGCVVGLSAEEEEMGLVIGLQTIADLFVASLGSSGNRPGPRAMIITTLPMGALLPMLRDVFRAQLAIRGKLDADFVILLKRFLERISISRVFDVSGLWEALGELDSLASHDGSGPESPSSRHEMDVRGDEADVEYAHSSAKNAPQIIEPQSSPLSDPPSSLPDEFEFVTALPKKTPPGQRTEIADSEDEEGFSSPVSPSRESPKPSLGFAGAFAEEIVAGRKPSEQDNTSLKRDEKPNEQEDPKHPDIVLVTHISTLMSSLFRQREKDTAHKMLQLLSSHLRYLTRSPDHGGPLVMILNSTTSPSDITVNSESTTTGTTTDRPQDPERPPRPTELGSATKTSKPLDPTLRSIFNPPPLPVSGLNYSYDTPLSRRNKPSFGLVFTQLLDLHLLCTSVPKSRADAEALFAPPSEVARSKGAIEYGWVVEVLLDEIGVWEEDRVREGKPRRSREQRWGAVDVRRDEGGVRVADAFERREKVVTEIRLAGGFGGRRV